MLTDNLSAVLNFLNTALTTGAGLTPDDMVLIRDRIQVARDDAACLMKAAIHPVDRLPSMPSLSEKIVHFPARGGYPTSDNGGAA